MRLLLDTNVFLWAQAATARLGEARGLIEDNGNDVLVSAVTPWEIAIKYAAGRLRLPEPPERYVPDAIREMSARPVAIEHGHAVAVAALPMLHRDPFDRLLIAQALALDATLITSDAQIAEYEAPTLLI